MNQGIGRLVIWLATTHALVAGQPVTSLQAVRAMAPEDARQGRTVNLEATVLYADTAKGEMFVDDGSASSYVKINGAAIQAGTAGLRTGSRVEIVGRTVHIGLFPHVAADAIRVTGTGPLPEPYRPAADELFQPRLDSDWVEVPAVVIGVETGGLGYTMVVEVFGLEFKADVPPTPDADRRVAVLMQRPILMKAIVGTIFNQQLQMTGRHFFVPSFDDMVPTGSIGRDDDAPVRQALELLTGSSGPNDLVRLRGVVTQDDSKGFYLRDGSGSAFVQTALSGRFPPGTQVEATGFGGMAPYRPILRATGVKELGRVAPPAPRAFVFDAYELSKLQDELVALEAEFLGSRQGPAEILLQCRADGRFFEATIPATGVNAVGGLRTGDRLRLTGICKLFTTHPMPRPEWADGFRLNLATNCGLTILERAPWWTTRRLLAALGITGAASFIGIAGIFLLRRQVARQMKVISAQLRDDAVHTERDRMARELHDTIEQQLTGVSLQIEGIARAATSKPDALQPRLKVARRMIGHIRAEARRSVWDLRSRILERDGLPAALRAMAAVDSFGEGPAIELVLDDSLPRMAAGTEFHLLRIAQEALTNAVKHSGAEKVSIELAAADGVLSLAIRDSGQGFDPSSLQLRDPIHFGTLGMAERAERIGATLQIHSAPGAGCAVVVSLPITPSPPTS
jgi:signal transduction histidine kinase